MAMQRGKAWVKYAKKCKTHSDLNRFFKEIRNRTLTLPLSSPLSSMKSSDPVLDKISKEIR
jgi:hypothetical protein